MSVCVLSMPMETASALHAKIYACGLLLYKKKYESSRCTFMSNIVIHLIQLSILVDLLSFKIMSIEIKQIKRT